MSNKKTIKQVLEKSELKYKHLFEMVSDGIIIVQDGDIQYANPKITEILRYKNEEIIKTSFKKYIPEEELPKFIKKYKKIKESKNPIEFETVLLDKFKRNIYVEMNLRSINYQEKLVDLIIIKEISYRKQIEEIMHQREQEFKNLVEGASDIIARFDSEFRYLYINPAIENEVKIHHQEVFWKTLREIGADEEIAQVWEEALEIVFTTEKERVVYTQYLTLKSKKYYYTRLLPELNKEGKVRTVLAISRDITEAKEIDKIKSEFISVSSHQLRTPLSIIRWCTVMFLDGMLGKVTNEQKGYLNKIYGATKDLIKISNAFFNVAILDLGILSVIPKEIDLISITRESINDLEIERFEKEIKIVEKYESDILLVKADKRILRIIFKSLLSNAIKYGHQGGNIWLEIKKREKDLLVKISDDGFGIPKDQQSKIFTKFFRADNIKKKEIYGIGLDLHIMKEIIVNFQGNVWFESPNPDLKGKRYKGTSFYFTIPLSGMRKRKKGDKGDKGLIKV